MYIITYRYLLQVRTAISSQFINRVYLLTYIMLVPATKIALVAPGGNNP